MSKTLIELKRNYQTNSREILIIERNLALTIENELKTELKHMRKFEKLNPHPHGRFLDGCKSDLCKFTGL